MQKRTLELSRKHGIPFRQALNELVRAGLRAESAARPSNPFEVKPFHMGRIAGLDYDDIEGLLEYGEGEDHR